MPDENINSTDVLGALEYLEDYSLDNKSARVQHYKVIQSALERQGHIDRNSVERVLAVCVHDLKEEMKYTFVVMNVISDVIHKVKDRTYEPPLDLVPSALAVITVINTTCLLTKVETLKVVCYDTLRSYPDSTLIAIAENVHMDILNMLNLYCHVRIPSDMRLQACKFLHKLLKLLPPEKKKTFIGSGITVWFSKIIPTAMAHMQQDDSYQEMLLQILELLTEDLIHFDYTNEKSWVEILECICQSDKYPLIMQTILYDGYHHNWDRLWIVFIKLLKHQITQSFGSIGTPINSMLPVVEAAFKMDVPNRCKAFECWNILIDSFSTETNESNIVKRIKLLVIPLKSNNAKTEETALAKFKCWWHLITKFQSKMDRFLDMILISFLQFIFGRHNAVDKMAVLPGQITLNVKKQTIPAIVEMVGHVDCTGCTDLQRLNGKIITTKHLVDNWNHWIYSLTSSILIAATDEAVLNNQQIKCLWKSFILTIGELPDNNIRKDLFYEILSTLRHLIQQSEGKGKLADIVFNVLLMSLFDGDTTIKVLLKTKKGDNNPMNETLDILQEHVLRNFYKSHEKRELVTKLKHVTNLVVNKHFNPTHVVGRFLLELPATDTALTLWTALAESVYENERMCVKNLMTMLMWPLENLDLFGDVKLAAIAWHRLYLLVQPKLAKTDIEEDIMNILLISENFTESVVFFRLSALLAVIKCKFADEQFTGNKEVELLKSLTSSVKDYESIELLFPMMVDILTLVLHNVTVNVNETLASHALICFKNVLKIGTQGFNDQHKEHIPTSLGHILKSVDKLFNINSYSNLGAIICDDLLQSLGTLREPNSMKSDILGLLKTVMQKNKDNDQALFSKIKAAIDNVDNVTTPVVISTNEIQENVNELSIDKFNTPTTNQVPKKSKKKETSIVNTVSENGEEYVVVKSNWKFNPRKLTEHQKERLKRKREDIPALYQDLSQSQDEFQLTSWKTDSQDTTSSRSESRSNAPTNEDATTILKNLPSSEVVPNILENILTKDKNDNTNNTNDALPRDKSNITEPVTPKNTKSPRMALKDRVFRNVRNLMEKSSIHKENKESEELDQFENIPRSPIPAKMDLENNKTEIISKTPAKTKAKHADNVINSAPPLISADRPSRVKRKPKKFDDVELLALKKSRHSLHGTSSDAKTVQTAPTDYSSESGGERNDEVLNKSINIVEGNDLMPGVDKTSVIQQNEEVIEIHDSDMTDMDTSKKGNEQVAVEVINEKAQDNVVDVNNTAEDIVVTNGDILNTDKMDSKISERNDDLSVKVVQEISTPKQSNDKKVEDQKSTVKKSSVKKSRIEKELAIDMVEGHPFLKMNSDKRLTRKAIVTPLPSSGRRKGLTEKLNKSKSDSNTPAKTDKKSKSKKEIENVETSFTVNETQDSSEASRDSAPEDHCSEDVIESSQDSTFSTLSVKSAKKMTKKNPVVSIEKLNPALNYESNVSQSILDCGAPIDPVSSKANNNTKDDSELPINKTAVEEKSHEDLTENMDTEPINEADICDEVIIIDAVPPPITISSDETVGSETQEMAEADTQTVNPVDYMGILVSHEKTSDIIIPHDTESENTAQVKVDNEVVNRAINSLNDITITLSESPCLELENTADVSSPFNDDAQRNQDFLNNTLEISPIKTMSPDRDKKSPSPETSSDYVVIKLTSPVHSNGEPFEKCASPEFFTNDKVSPDKRDQSPPRVEITVTNTSPSSSLSLKKNRPQVRPNGRAAQMLGLCVPGKLNTIINPERNEPEENKKGSPSNTAARRNLRIFYNTVHNDNNDDGPSENESEHFLKFKKSLPAVDSSPAGPILKRKLVEITDDATISPASKRKRVSFHDPPVSTTISVQKYIEPGGLRSPQNSAQKRLERQIRHFVPVKSPKRLENVFRLDSALTKTLESFTDVDVNNTTDDTQQSSLDDTPSVEIVKASELNDSDPICPDLLDCKDPIDNIASELSSPAMKSLLIKELEGKVETVGDLAKMTELEVNRLCIKAPKVKIAKKVLTDYAANKAKAPDATVTIDAAMFDETMNEGTSNAVDIEVQTDGKVVSDTEVQTTVVPVTFGSMQTEVVPTSHLSVQTDETGEGSTADVIKSCLLKRSDFIEELSEQLQQSSIQQMSEKLPFSVMTDLFMKKVTPLNSDVVLSRLLDQQNTDAPAEDHKTNEITFLQDFICDRFDSKDLILFCSQLLQRVHDKPA